MPSQRRIPPVSAVATPRLIHAHPLARTSKDFRDAALVREPDRDPVAVGDHVVATLEPERGVLPCARVAAELDELVPGDDLGADEALLDVGVDLAPRGPDG